MKKLASFLIATTLLVPSLSFAFQDITPGSTLRPALDQLIERGSLEDKGFFRAEETVPAEMFWEVVLRDAGFDPNSAIFNTPIPPNVDPESELAQFLREANRRNFLKESELEFFDSFDTIDRVRALEIMVKTKALLPQSRSSKKFRDLFPKLPSRAGYLPILEAGYACGMLETGDVTTWNPHAPLLRKELVTWLYRWNDHGVKTTALGTDSPVPQSATTYRRSTTRSTRRRSEGGRTAPTEKNTNRLTIQILDGNGGLPATTNSNIPDGDILAQVFNDVVSKYRFNEELTTQKRKDLINSAIEGMVQGIGDKYSSYIRPSKAQDFADNLSGNFEGIGAYVESIEGNFTITAPITGSPAEAAGIVAGDIVTHVDDESIEGLPIQDAIAKVKGPAGTTITLTIRRNTQTLKVTVTRGKITIPSVTLKWEKSVPVIGVHQFNYETTELFRRYINEDVLPNNPRGLIIDLRNNPGGFLNTAAEMAEFFVPAQTKVYSVDYKNGLTPTKSSRTGELVDLKNIVVLQNKGTASASEILIGMLQDLDRATVVGTASHGKGTVQSIQNYNNGGMLKITVAKWLTPDGRWIHETGIIPEIEVSDPTPEEKKQNTDRQLDTAVQEILSR